VKHRYNRRLLFSGPEQAGANGVAPRLCTLHRAAGRDACITRALKTETETLVESLAAIAVGSDEEEEGDEALHDASAGASQQMQDRLPKLREQVVS
jgi:hypothetical protein